MLKITECPRDAMQGLVEFIPTDLKVSYLNLLLQVGFDRLDFGSFVSPKAIPQMRDTAELMDKLVLNEKTDLLAIIANKKGAESAIAFEPIKFLGFPFSISETFQKRNTNASREEALDRIKEIQEIATKYNKQVMIYLSMGFGNPYGDPWEFEIVADWASKIKALEIKHFSLADTIGNSTSQLIKTLFPLLRENITDVEWSMHLHSSPFQIKEKVEAALEVGCKRLDSAIKGFGGCPMAKDELVGNIATEVLLGIAEDHKIETGINHEAFNKAFEFSQQIFS